MKSALFNKPALLVLDVVVILICIIGLYLNFLKASLPITITTSDGHLIIQKVDRSLELLSKGDIIQSIDNLNFSNWEEVELYLDGKNIGEDVVLNLMDAGAENALHITLAPYYSIFDLSIIGIVGLVFIIFAILVRIKAPDNFSAKLFHLSSLGLGVVIIMTAGNYKIAPLGYGYINRIIWLFAYSFTPVLFIHFTSSFVQFKHRQHNAVLIFLYLSAGINSIILSYFFLSATLAENFQSIANYVFYFDSFFRLFVITCIVIAISICIYAYRKAEDLEDRKRMQWLLLGFFIGPFSFVVFWVLPIVLIGHSLIPEALVLIFLTAIPVTFSIAIIKYHLMDINLIVRRSLLYSALLAIIIVTYIVLSFIITLFVSDLNPAIPSVLTAIAVVVALQPLKTSVQKFIDKKFFRVEYDYREEQKNLLDSIKSTYDIQSLAEMIVSRMDALIPVERIGFFNLNKEDGKVRIFANKGWEFLKGRSIRFEAENLKTDLTLPVAVDNKVEPGLNVESADVKVFKRWGMVLVFPIKSPSGIIHAFLVMGEKKAGTRYFKDDIDLLNTVATAAALTIDRIILQEDLIREHLEAERLKELNEVKSLFVSSMVHELKRPLSGIKMFTELLQFKKDDSPESEKKYLSIIDGESEKLKRLINNILDNAMIEKGIKNYQLERLEINSLVQKTVCEAEYLFKIKNQKIELNLHNQKAYIDGDAEAIESMLNNLITNAGKYSPENTKTTVTTFIEKDHIAIVIKDEGKGIANDELENIFQPYFRIKEKSSSMVDGTGLGLSIVEHIVEGHNGRIEVESSLGKGTTFKVFLPLLNQAKKMQNN